VKRFGVAVTERHARARKSATDCFAVIIEMTRQLQLQNVAENNQVRIKYIHQSNETFCYT